MLISMCRVGVATSGKTSSRRYTGLSLRSNAVWEDPKGIHQNYVHFSGISGNIRVSRNSMRNQNTQSI